MATQEERMNAIRVAARKLLMGCQGLVIYLSMLKSRYNIKDRNNQQHSNDQIVHVGVAC